MEAAKLKIINPATEEVITELETDDSRSIIEKYNRAMSAQLDWARSSAEKRGQVIMDFRNQLVEKVEILARTLTEEVGKPIAQSRNEIDATVKRVDFFLDHFENLLEPQIVHRDPSDRNLVEEIHYDPVGVIANISAWNYPYFVGANVFVPALLTGNAVLYKPSELVPLTALSIGELLYEAELSDELFIPVIGDSFAGQELLKWPVQGVFFTGSHRAGRHIADVCSRRFVRLQLELGGKDPTYVCEDANVSAAAASLADGAFYNTGQSCCSVERIYVHKHIFDEFVNEFVRQVKAFKIGDPLEEDTYIGPLAREPQLKVLERQVADAVSNGGQILTGGKRIDRKGFYFEPTVVVNVNHSMELMREESFGPIIGIQSVSDDLEAIRLMNDTRYGLTAGVYTPDEDRARRVLSRVVSGSAYWNCCDRVSPRLPWTARNDSGIGVTLGEEGIRAMQRSRSWHLKQE